MNPRPQQCQCQDDNSSLVFRTGELKRAVQRQHNSSYINQKYPNKCTWWCHPWDINCSKSHYVVKFKEYHSYKLFQMNSIMRKVKTCTLWKVSSVCQVYITLCAIITKEDRFCNFLFAPLNNVSLPNCGHLKEGICSTWSKLFSLKVNPNFEGNQNRKWNCLTKWLWQQNSR